MRHRYLILSDLHLCDVEEHSDGWKAYKSAAYLFDDDLAQLLEHHLATTAAGVEPVLVLNGDVFDFDLVDAVPQSAPFPMSHFERRRGLAPTSDKAVWKLERMLVHHPRFVQALARYLARGHRLVYVMGNHDREFHFAAVKASFVAALRAAAQAEGGGFADAAVRFEPWFYYEPGELFVEHGNQYDPYNSFRYLLSPVIEEKGRPTLALPLGNLSNRMLLSKMGFFNPHASDYILNVYHYIAHWLRYYALSRRHILLTWFLGSLVVMARLFGLRRKLRREPPALQAEQAALAARFSLPLSTLAELAKLHGPPLSGRFYFILRVLWIDRLLLVLALLGGTLLLWLSGGPLWLKLLVPLSVFPLVYMIYESLAQGDSIFTFEHRLPDCARAIAALLPVRVVTFGHTHNPRAVPLDARLTFVDTGTWAPILKDLDGQTLQPGLRNYLLVDFSTDEAVVHLDCWRTVRQVTT